MTHEELVYDFKSIKDITGPDVPVLIEYAINSNITLSDAINLREILSVKINEYKNTLIDKYQKAVNEVAHKRGIDFMPIPNKHLIYIENKIKFHTINLCGNFDLIIAGFQGEDTHVLSKSQEEDMKLLKRRIFNFDNELKNKHYTLDDVSRERRTHKKYIIESEKIGRKVGPEVCAQLNSLDLLEEDLKVKNNSILLNPNTPTIIKTNETRDFASRLINCDKTKVINNMISNFHNCKGRKIALILRALKELKFIDLPQKGKAEIYKDLFQLTGWNTSETSINNYLSGGTKDNIKEEEVIWYAEILNK